MKCGQERGIVCLSFTYMQYFNVFLENGFYLKEFDIITRQSNDLNDTRIYLNFYCLSPHESVFLFGNILTA